MAQREIGLSVRRGAGDPRLPAVGVRPAAEAARARRRGRARQHHRHLHRAGRGRRHERSRRRHRPFDPRRPRHAVAVAGDSAGHFPTVDVLDSVSRVAPAPSPRPDQRRARRRAAPADGGLRGEPRTSSRSAPTATGSNPLVDRAIELRDPIEAFLCQGMDESSPARRVADWPRCSPRRWACPTRRGCDEEVPLRPRQHPEVPQAMQEDRGAGDHARGRARGRGRHRRARRPARRHRRGPPVPGPTHGRRVPGRARPARAAHARRLRRPRRRGELARPLLSARCRVGGHGARPSAPSSASTTASTQRWVLESTRAAQRPPTRSRRPTRPEPGVSDDEPCRPTATFAGPLHWPASRRSRARFEAPRSSTRRDRLHRRRRSTRSSVRTLRSGTSSMATLPPAPPSAAPAPRAQTSLERRKQYLGVPYRWGGTDPDTAARLLGVRAAGLRGLRHRAAAGQPRPGQGRHRGAVARPGPPGRPRRLRQPGRPHRHLRRRQQDDRRPPTPATS